jgi:hypothetical protein
MKDTIIGTFIDIKEQSAIQCDFVTCFHGGGLAGKGYCAGKGNPFDKNCKEYLNEAEALEQWEREQNESNNLS